MYRSASIHHAMAEDWRSLLRRWYARFKQWMMTNPRNELVWHTVGIKLGPNDLESRAQVDVSDELGNVSDELAGDDWDWLSDSPWNDEPCGDQPCEEWHGDSWRSRDWRFSD